MVRAPHPPAYPPPHPRHRPQAGGSRRAAPFTCAGCSAGSISPHKRSSPANRASWKPSTNSKASRPRRSSGSAPCCRPASQTTILDGSTSSASPARLAGGASRRTPPGLLAMALRPAASFPPTPRPSPSTSANPPTGCPTPSPSSPSTSNSSPPASRPKPSHPRASRQPRGLLRRRPPAPHRPHTAADRPRPLGTRHCRPRLCRRLRPAPRSDGSPSQASHRRHRQQTPHPHHRRPLVAPDRAPKSGRPTSRL